MVDVADWLLNIPATCYCISGTHLPSHTKFQIELVFSFSYSILTPGQPVLAPTLYRQALGYHSHWHDSEKKSPMGKAGFDLGTAALEADALPQVTDALL